MPSSQCGEQYREGGLKGKTGQRGRDRLTRILSLGSALFHSLLYEHMESQVTALGRLGVTAEESRRAGGSSAVRQRSLAARPGVTVGDQAAEPKGSAWSTQAGAPAGSRRAAHRPLTLEPRSSGDHSTKPSTRPRDRREEAGYTRSPPPLEEELLAMREAPNSSPSRGLLPNSTRDYSSSEDESTRS